MFSGLALDHETEDYPGKVGYIGVIRCDLTVKTLDVSLQFGIKLVPAHAGVVKNGVRLELRVLGGQKFNIRLTAGHELMEIGLVHGIFAQQFVNFRVNIVELDSC